MGALIADFDSPAKNVLGRQAYPTPSPVTAQIFRGAMVMLDTNGNAVPAAAGSAASIVVGRAVTGTADAPGNLATPGTYASAVDVEWGTFFMNIASGGSITQATVGKIVYAASDNEVTSVQTSPATLPVAGVVDAIVPNGVIVRLDPHERQA